jgi:hypothetical protein
MVEMSGAGRAPVRNVPNLAPFYAFSHFFAPCSADSLIHVLRDFEVTQRSAQCRSQAKILGQMIGSLKKCMSDTNLIQLLSQVHLTLG